MGSLSHEVTVSQEKVLLALPGRSAGEPAWRDGFTWNDVGALFEEPGPGTGAA
ncbi:hypothetical protein [Streptomyces bungoensis]|uniref:hypothetical protein n=1 Tax=Streptomyces bungoensis TaxID=285568 RepID=UPI000AA27A0D|nr:hypothetical protein [Streptomyces bungoensis]